jgi:serine protease Do
MKRYASFFRLSLLCLAFGAAALAPMESWGQRRSHAPVLAAFRDVISSPSKSTVQVFGDGYRVALGAVVRSDGHIVTKASELKGKTKVEVQLADRQGKRPATIVETDVETDLALLHVEEKDLTPIEWSATTPPVGSWLVTSGVEERSPVAIGVLSAAPRKIEAQSGALGVVLADSEARILDVRPGMAADEAGLKEGDLIIDVDGVSVQGRETLQRIIKSHQPGDKVALRVRRGAEELTVIATLSSFRQLVEGERSEFQNNLGGPLSVRRAGFPSVIQHDTVLKPADCGGPIVDLDGKAVGLNIARAGRVESYALPASVVQEFVAKVLDTQLVTAPATEQQP